MLENDSGVEVMLPLCDFLSNSSQITHRYLYLGDRREGCKKCLRGASGEQEDCAYLFHQGKPISI